MGDDGLILNRVLTGTLVVKFFIEYVGWPTREGACEATLLTRMTTFPRGSERCFPAAAAAAANRRTYFFLKRLCSEGGREFVIIVGVSVAVSRGITSSSLQLAGSINRVWTGVTKLSCCVHRS